MPFNWRSGRLQAGKLRHKIDIVIPNPAQDSTGGIDLNVDKVYANVWASVEAMGGTETLAAQSQMSTSTHQILIRYIGAAPSWVNDYGYVAGQLVSANGYLQQAQADGISGDAAPTWNNTAGGTTNDGLPSTGLVWKNLGLAPLNTGVTAAMQIWFQNRQFQITSVLNPDERNKMLCIMAVEINDSRQQITTQPGGLS